jgi:hypothetical protein
VSGNDVYVGAAGGLWKNGAPQNGYGFVSSVYVSGRDVYVAGGGGSSGALLWKNGVMQKLTDETRESMANSVFVSGSDVYVVGEYTYDMMTANSARLWKNGTLQRRSPLLIYFENENNYAAAHSVFVSGNDIYVAGKYGNSPRAVLWKNGIAENLTDGTRRAEARSVYLSNSDVYVAGQNGNFAMLWVNGIPLGLTDGVRLAGANSVFVVKKSNTIVK